MALAHLTLAGAAEAILTSGVLAYLIRADPLRLAAAHPGIPVSTGTAGGTGTEGAPRSRALTPGRVAVGFIAVMALLTPLGLLAPGGAFGEDAPGDLDLGNLDLQAVPTGLARYNGFWSHTLLGGYGFADGQHANLAYVLSAVVGIVIVAAAVYAIGKLIETLVRRRSGPPRAPEAGSAAAVDTHEPSRA
jgi:cobalt/nickel transport system permease protein